MSVFEFFSRFNYYAKPEGIAPLDKVVSTSGYGLLTGLVFGTHDVFLYSKTRTISDTMRCFGYWMVPMGTMGATFAATTFIATNLRGKDDKVNYFLGALSAGAVFHNWQKCGLMTLYTTMFLCLFAVCKKDSVENGWNFFGDNVFTLGDMTSSPMWQTPSGKIRKYERGWTKD